MVVSSAVTHLHIDQFILCHHKFKEPPTKKKLWIVGLDLQPIFPCFIEFKKLLFDQLVFYKYFLTIRFRPSLGSSSRLSGRTAGAAPGAPVLGRPLKIEDKSFSKVIVFYI